MLKLSTLSLFLPPKDGHSRGWEHRRQWVGRVDHWTTVSSQLGVLGLLDGEEVREEGAGRAAAGPGREMRSRETAGRAVNARWGVNSELRTPFTPPTPTRVAILGGENICSAGAVGEVASFPRGQPAVCSF